MQNTNHVMHELHELFAHFMPADIDDRVELVPFLFRHFK